jgi:hypothetical protein
MTVIQEAIEIVQNRCVDLSIADDADNPHARNAIAEHEATLSVLKSLLPKEREQIEQAYEEGYNNAIWECGTPKSTTATEYYNETFKPL